MPDQKFSTPAPDPIRRSLLLSGGVAAGMAFAASASAQSETDTAPKVLDGQPVPEPPPNKSAGPVRPGRGSHADRQGRRGHRRRARHRPRHCRGIGGQRRRRRGARHRRPGQPGLQRQAGDAGGTGRDRAADPGLSAARASRSAPTSATSPRCVQPRTQVERDHGKIDIVVANAAIQRWMPLLEMQDSDWRDVIDNNLNGTANTIRAFAPKMVATQSRPDHRAVVDAGEAWHQERAPAIQRLQMGHPGADEIGRAWNSGEYNITVNALIPGLVDTPLTRYETRLRESMAENRPEAAREPDAAAGLGHPGAHRAAEGGLAAAGRHLAGGRVPGLRRRGDGHRRGIRGDRRRQRQGHLTSRNAAGIDRCPAACRTRASYKVAKRLPVV